MYKILASFKDKPLKKIIADKRVTIDAIHQGMSDEFLEKRVKNKEAIEKIKQLQLENNENPTEELKTQISDLEKVVEEYDPNESIEYYLDTGELLNEYYSKKQETTENTEITVIDFMNKNKTKKEEKLVTNYMRKIDDSFIKEHYIQDIHNCPLCLGKLIMKNVDSLLICEECGYTDNIIINSEKVSYKDPPRESSYFYISVLIILMNG